MRSTDDLPTKLLIDIQDLSKFHWILETNAARETVIAVYIGWNEPWNCLETDRRIKSQL